MHNRQSVKIIVGIPDAQEIYAMLAMIGEMHFQALERHICSIHLDHACQEIRGTMALYSQKLDKEELTAVMLQYFV